MAVILAAVLLCACGEGSGASGSEPVSNDGYYLDTICSVSVYRMTGEDGTAVDASGMEDEALDAINGSFEVCKDLEAKVSRTRKDSDISRINGAKGEWTEVSSETVDLIRKGLDYSEVSGGDFDITVGGVTKLWDFHAAEGEAEIPDEEAVSEAVKHVDYKGVEIDGSRVRLKDPESEIDLGGIAKGYIGDRMTDYLESRGVVSAVVNLGGNVACYRGSAKDSPWKIGVQDAVVPENMADIVEKDSGFLISSGDYQRYYEYEGKRYHHIIDPQTLMPAEGKRGTTVICGEDVSCADGDMLSTALFILPREKADELAKKYNVEQVYYTDTDGNVTTLFPIQQQ